MYALGKKSREELKGVHPDLVRVVERAIALTSQDFAVHDGLRTKAEQAEYVKRGVSQTMNSKHRPQADGFGHAVDLVPYINGKLRWEHAACYVIAEAVRKAATELGVRVRWGGCWEEITGTKRPVHLMVRDYSDARRAAGRKAFVDAPHFEVIL